MVMIIISANEHGDFKGGSEVGSIKAHWDFLKKKGKVFWRLVPSGGKLGSKIKHNPHKGFFYDVNDNVLKVTHSFSIEMMIRGEDLTNDYREFVPEFRKYHIGSGFLILINSIKLLKSPRELNEFWKEDGSETIERVQNFVWVEDSEFD